MKVTKANQVSKEPANTPLFTGGLVTRQNLVTKEISKFFNMGIVNFGKGARNKFHTHTSAQVLIVTAGTGIVATEKERHTVKVGDVIQVPAGEKHWHSASKDSDFSHMYVTSADSQTTQLED